MLKSRKITPGMTFEEYWSKNKVILTLSKLTSEEFCKAVWEDITLCLCKI